MPWKGFCEKVLIAVNVHSPFCCGKNLFWASSDHTQTMVNKRPFLYVWWSMRCLTNLNKSFFQLACVKLKVQIRNFSYCGLSFGYIYSLKSCTLLMNSNPMCLRSSIFQTSNYNASEGMQKIMTWIEHHIATTLTLQPYLVVFVCQKVSIWKSWGSHTHLFG